MSTATTTDAFSGVDISKILNSDGNIVSCVLLHASQPQSSSFSIISPSSPSSALDKDEDLTTSVTTTTTTTSSSPTIIKTDGNIAGIKDDQIDDEDNKHQNTQNNKKLNIQNTSIASSSSSSLPSPTTISTNIKYKLSHLVSQVDIDTTPRKRSVEKVLGGPFTFLGQYEDLGVVAMALRLDEYDDNTNKESSPSLPPFNPHVLQPPLHNIKVRGDILLMKTKTIDDEDEKDDDERDVDTDNNIATASSSTSEMNGSDNVGEETDFFLNFTSEEYLQFASRTDIAIPKMQNDSSINDIIDKSIGQAERYDNKTRKEEEENYDDDNDNDDENDHYRDINDDEYDPDYNIDDDEEEDNMHYLNLAESEERVGMMNLLMGQILRKFREDHGRGPETNVLLQMRQALAQRLGVIVPDIMNDDAKDDNEHNNDDGREKQNSLKNTVINNDNSTSVTKRNPDSDVDHQEMQSSKRSSTDAFGGEEQQEHNNMNAAKKCKGNSSEEPESKKVRWSMETILKIDNDGEDCSVQSDACVAGL